MPESWGKLIAKLGVTSVIALYLVHLLGGEMKGMLSETRNAAADARMIMQQHVAATEPLANSIQVLINLQLQNCANQAANTLERDACFRAQYQPPQR